ncbi:Rieske domain-containing protein [Aplysia californica]|uniref:Rieske domain-containing protein n=1 Tax=Aplysia californica TaxID=6500 RepID=A0ABM0JR04_APLCA|nr:Rieske domain-containing protein [Aplysia californica]
MSNVASRMEAEDNKLYLPVPGVKLQDLLDWQDPDQRNHRHLVHVSNPNHELKVSFDSMNSAESHVHRKCFGQAVDLNDDTIALFRIGKEVYATQAKCPHAGGPLHLADIEELVLGQVSLRCPWHKWTFNIDNGCSISPPGRNVVARTYPVKVGSGGELRIGFESFGPSAFEMDF